MNIQDRRLALMDPSLPPPCSVFRCSFSLPVSMCLIIIHSPCCIERPKDSDLPRGQSLYASGTIGEGTTVSIREEGKL